MKQSGKMWEEIGRSRPANTASSIEATFHLLLYDSICAAVRTVVRHVSASAVLLEHLSPCIARGVLNRS